MRTIQRRLCGVGLAALACLMSALLAFGQSTSVTVTGTTGCSGNASFSAQVSIVGLPPGCVATLSGNTINVTGCTAAAISVGVGCPSQQLVTGNVMQCTASVLNTSNQGVSWSSNNTAAATVSASGVVTAVAPGPVTISAASQEDPTKIGSTYLQVSIPPTAITVQAETTKSSSAGIVVSPTNDTGGGEKLALTSIHQWWDYQINVPVGGTYAIAARLGVDQSATAGGTGVHFEMPAGTPITPSLFATGANTWTTVTSQQIVMFQAGANTIRLICDSLPTATAPYKGFINWFQLVPTINPAQNPPPPTATPAGFISSDATPAKKEN